MSASTESKVYLNILLNKLQRLYNSLFVEKVGVFFQFIEALKVGLFSANFCINKVTSEHKLKKKKYFGVQCYGREIDTLFQSYFVTRFNLCARFQWKLIDRIMKYSTLKRGGKNKGMLFMGPMLWLVERLWDTDTR